MNGATHLVQKRRIDDGDVDALVHIRGENGGLFHVVWDVLPRGEHAKAAVDLEQPGVPERVGVLEGHEGGGAAEKCDGRRGRA